MAKTSMVVKIIENLNIVHVNIHVANVVVVRMPLSVNSSYVVFVSVN